MFNILDNVIGNGEVVFGCIIVIYFLFFIIMEFNLVFGKKILLHSEKYIVDKYNNSKNKKKWLRLNEKELYGNTEDDLKKYINEINKKIVLTFSRFVSLNLWYLFIGMPIAGFLGTLLYFLLCLLSLFTLQILQIVSVLVGIITMLVAIKFGLYKLYVYNTNRMRNKK